jgi:hypothetical protein
MKMKLAFAIIFLAAVLLHFTGLGQDVKTKKFPVAPLITEDINDITVADNIDLVLVQSAPDYVAVKIADNAVGKLKISTDGTSLNLERMKNLPKNERLLVYVFVNDLEYLTLTGNSFAVSRGVLNSRHLQVNIIKGGRVSIKSKGKLQVNTKGKYEIVKGEEEYSSVFAMD